jgi:hypothetical protein
MVEGLGSAQRYEEGIVRSTSYRIVLRLYLALNMSFKTSFGGGPETPVTRKVIQFFKIISYKLAKRQILHHPTEATGLLST